MCLCPAGVSSCCGWSFHSRHAVSFSFQRHSSPKSARRYPDLVAPRKNSTYEASRTVNVLRGTWERDGKGTQMKVSSPLTALQLSQADKQENHLKPKLIFFFFPSSKRAKRKTSNIRWPSVMWCVTRLSKGGAGWSIYRDSWFHFRGKKILLSQLRIPQSSEKNSILRNCLCLLARSCLWYITKNTGFLKIQHKAIKDDPLLFLPFSFSSCCDDLLTPNIWCRLKATW